MRIARNMLRCQAGHTLWIVLVVTGVIGIVTASYLNLINSQNLLTVRSQTWNNCIPLVEAGIEEALAQLNRFANSNLANNGWTSISNGFSKQRQLGEGYYQVTVAFTNILKPVITAEGFLSAPLTVAKATPGGNPASGAKGYISRRVQVTCKKEPVFTKALIAKEKINFNGNNVFTDSYDSTSSLYSDNKGQYDPTKTKDNGDVAVNADIINVGSVGNAKIMGNLLVGPKASVNIGPNGSVGDKAWVNGGKKGIQTGHLRKDANFHLPDVEVPWTGGAFAPTGGSGLKYKLDDGKFEMNNLVVNSGERMKIFGDAVLYVKGNVDIKGEIEIIPPAKLTIYVGGNASLSGAFPANHQPKDFIFYGLPGNKSIIIGTGGAQFNGVIYAPNASLTLNNQASVCGTVVAKDVTMSGNTSFHYDESLAGLGKFRGYSVLSWNEL
jgi:hypothetical protein